MERKSEDQAAHVAVLEAMLVRSHDSLRMAQGLAEEAGPRAQIAAIIAAIAALTASPQAAPEGGELAAAAKDVVVWYAKRERAGNRDELLRPEDQEPKLARLMRALASPQVQDGEAVAWQYRTPKLLSDGWHPWQQCDRELFDELTEHGSYAGRPVQVRALYATPQRAPGVSDDDVRELVDWIFTRFGAPIDAGELPQHIVQAVRRLEAALAAPVSAVGVDDCAKCGESNRLNCNDECWNCGAALASGVDAETEEDEADVIQRRRLAAKHAAAQDQGEGNGP
jgi:hypothetical protein